MPDSDTEPRIEQATIEDLPQLVELLVALFSEEEDFRPDKSKQEHGLRLILEQPNRGRIFVLRTDRPWLRDLGRELSAGAHHGVRR